MQRSFSSDNKFLKICIHLFAYLFVVMEFLYVVLAVLDFTM